MTFTDYWNSLVARNTKLGEPGARVEITAANFRRALEQAFEAGEDSGPDNSVFGQIFGRLNRPY